MGKGGKQKEAQGGAREPRAGRETEWGNVGKLSKESWIWVGVP